MTRPFSPADPHATPTANGQPYRVERRILARIPCLLELPPEGETVRAVCLVYHGAWAAKEGKLGVYSALATQGMAVVIPDAPLHGERQTDTPPGLNAREYVWESVRRSVAESGALLDALAELYGPLPASVIGSSMGGYVALTLARTEPRVNRAAALITSGVWNEPEVKQAEARAFLEVNRPNTHADSFPPTPLLLASGDSDPTFPLETHHSPTATALRAAYGQAGYADHFHERTFAGVGHYTSQGMRDAVLDFLTPAFTIKLL
ncbi:alpha/beta hydrolase family protein [Deinococcus arenicola]|uniref:Alpha/beta fold hydrolase n=1 Tax=Deinococcus arenicola TaxID=2994950 RepID=A0ABU4DUH2_9DEIO|nr:alpha/beta fold hydrolase [Deinococcus sp. ZS9-10]MDV6375545.1 alpha/beta fold hydrolase [Deinococcus sp. ZS9-10]